MENEGREKVCVPLITGYVSQVITLTANPIYHSSKFTLKKRKEKKNSSRAELTLHYFHVHCISDPTVICASKNTKAAKTAGPSFLERG